MEICPRNTLSCSVSIDKCITDSIQITYSSILKTVIWTNSYEKRTIKQSVLRLVWTWAWQQRMLRVAVVCNYRAEHSTSRAISLQIPVLWSSIKNVIWAGAGETHELQIFDNIKHKLCMVSMVIYFARTIKEYQKLNCINLILIFIIKMIRIFDYTYIHNEHDNDNMIVTERTFVLILACLATL